uniref:Ig-like domain-containing protein n=1 Tax=Labrus bergylta TaxID=56723 RepID=A0A3Q3FUR1_9LABR
MSGIKRVTFFYVLFYLKGFAKGDTEVCILKESCILPCSFKQGDKVLVHWNQIKGNTLVHSYFYDRDQLERQDESFKGRTSLFQDQISKGNVSLRLTGVKLEDQGRYKCYTSTTNGNKESFVDLNLEAPPSKVGIQQVGNRITCSSEEIYPQPELTWSSSPPTNLNNEAIVQETEQFGLLYSISSSLIVQVGVIDLDYSCTISAGRNKRRATLFKPGTCFKENFWSLHGVLQAALNSSYEEFTLTSTKSLQINFVIVCNSCVLSFSFHQYFRH